MPKIAVLADSSCDFTPAQAKAAGFDVVPLSITFEDGTVVRDGVDIDSATFFDRMEQSKKLPKTSQPSPDTFMEYFQKYADYTDIIYVSVGSRFSGSINAAANAARILEDEGFAPRVHLVDSLNASASSALLAIEAVRMAEEGHTAGEIVARLIDMREKIGIYFIPDSLEYLRKGGRIGRASAAVGGMLGIKPLLTVYNSEAASIDKVRGMQQACKKMMDRFLYNAKDVEHVVILHARAEDRALKLRAALTHSVATIDCRIVELGAVMGTYIGPGSIGLVFEEKEARW